jgi:hypothetical protein
MPAIEEPKASLRVSMTTSSRDWSASERDAWMYGIVVGWPDDALAELARQFFWAPDVVARLRRLHERFEALR